jgi:hypothetical protein
VDIDGPAEAIKVLKAVYGQLKQRLAQLGNAGVSTWGRWDNQGPRILIVIDEFSNLADDAADAGEREELWRRARMIAAEGRKAGILLAIALQDPTHKSMDLRIRRNCTRVAYRVQDADASRVVLGSDGAQHLAQHRFMTVAGQLVEGVAFDPSDSEITRFLQRRPVAALQAPAWLDADDSAPAQPDAADEITNLADQIRDAWARGESKRAMARVVGREYAGAFAGKLDQAIAWLSATTTPAQPATGPVAA